MTGPENVKAAADVLSVGSTVAVLLGWLPTAAALATLIWTVIRIAETETVRAVVRWARGKLDRGPRG